MGEQERTPAKAWLLLGLLFLGYACSSADREIISLLVEPMKADLSFSDTQMGMLQGIAFLAFYSVAGIPAGMLVDRMPRIRLLAAALTLWTFMTAFCGLVRTFGLLFVARAGVGVGETVLSPAALSLISDMFPKRRHGFAIGVYVGGSLVGASIAVGFGGILYGWLAGIGPVDVPGVGPLQPWQMTFLCVGAPGFLLALAFLLIAEPPRRTLSEDRVGGLRDFYREHWRFLSLHHVANGFTNLLALGVTAWAASYLIRTFGSNIAEVGPLLGFAFLVGGIAGMIGGGVISDRLLRYGSAARLWLCAATAALGALTALFLPRVADVYSGSVLIGLIVMFGSVPYSVANAALQEVVPSGMRGTISAVYYLSISVLGSLGPSAVAFLTDKVFHNPNRLSDALSIIVTAGFLASMALYLLAIRPYRSGMSAAQT